MRTKLTTPKSSIMIFITVFLLSSCTEVDGDARFSCNALSVNDGKAIVKVCDLNYSDLTASPWNYDGDYVRVTGYLDFSGDRIRLFSSRDSYVYSAGSSGVLLNASSADRAGLNEMAGSSQAVTVGGVFNISEDRSVDGVVGSINVMPKYFWRPPLPGQRPSL